MNQKKMKKMNGKKTKLIDANALKLALYYDVSKGTYGEFIDGSEVSLTDREILKLIDQQPTIDAEPVKHGKWIKADSQQYFRKHYPCFTCSECGYRKDSQKKWNYCPNCKARMDEE
jgi:hypothetical protein